MFSYTIKHFTALSIKIAILLLDFYPQLANAPEKFYFFHQQIKISNTQL